MNIQETKKLIDNVIENEFEHIQNTQEFKDLNGTDIDKESSKADELFKKLLKVMPEHRELLDEYYSAMNSFGVDFAKYYFKKGVIAGTTDLEFLKDTKLMEFI